MACNPSILKQVPLFALLDDEEAAVLAGQVEVKTFAPRQRIYKMGDAGDKAYVMVEGAARVSTVDEDGQEVIVDEPSVGEFFGFASMLEQTPHQTDAIALIETTCLEVDRHDISILLQRKPMAGMDMLTVLGRQFHSAQPTISRHLKVLERAGLVHRSVEGRVHRFRLRQKKLEEARGWIARHQAFWEGAVDRLDRLFSEPPRHAR